MFVYCVNVERNCICRDRYVILLTAYEMYKVYSENGHIKPNKHKCTYKCNLQRNI